MKGKVIEIIQVPYDSAHRNVRMAQAPNISSTKALSHFFVTEGMTSISIQLRLTLPSSPKSRRPLN